MGKLVRPRLSIKHTWGVVEVLGHIRGYFFLFGWHGLSHGLLCQDQTAGQLNLTAYLSSMSEFG